MEKPLFVYKNMIWEILDQGSKLALITILLENGFEGDCRVIAKIEGETTVLEFRDKLNHSLVLPINILDILNM